MIHEDHVGGNALLDRVILHGVDLVIVILPVVAAHQEPVGCAGLIRLNARNQAVFQHAAGFSAVPHQRA